MSPDSFSEEVEEVVEIHEVEEVFNTSHEFEDWQVGEEEFITST